VILNPIFSRRSPFFLKIDYENGWLPVGACGVVGKGEHFHAFHILHVESVGSAAVRLRLSTTP
jgi:hypothetical protein